MNQTTNLRTILSTHFNTKHNIDTLVHQQINQTNHHDWYLLGTDGCHLCETTYALLLTHQKRFELPNILVLDILDFYDKYDKQFVECLSSFIPILITPTQFLCYPFGIMDILALKKY